MNADDQLAREAKQWIEEIDSFKSPPPPRRLADMNGLESNDEQHQQQQQQRANGNGIHHFNNDMTSYSTPFSSAQHSRDGSYASDLRSNGGGGTSIVSGGAATKTTTTNNNDEQLPQDNFIVEKVRQFEDNDAHPYASHRRVETSKKIAAHGGNMAAFLVNNDKGKQRISKEEASKLRASVLQENRVYNPYPNPYSAGGNGSASAASSSSRRTDPSNSSGGSGTSSLVSQTRDTSSSSGIGSNGITTTTTSQAPGANGTTASSNNRQQQHQQQLPLQRRLQTQRSSSSTTSNPSAIATSTTSNSENITANVLSSSSRGPTPLSSPSTTISSSALTSPREDDRSAVGLVSVQRVNGGAGGTARDGGGKIYETPVVTNGEKLANGGGTSVEPGKKPIIFNNDRKATEEIYRSGEGDKKSSAISNSAALDKSPESTKPTSFSSAIMAAPMSAEDEEMASLYRIFDAEVKTFGSSRPPTAQARPHNEVVVNATNGVHHQEPNVGVAGLNGRISSTPTESQPLAPSGTSPSKKHHPLPPYVGIRHATTRTTHSESPAPASAALPPPPPRSVFSPPVTLQQRHQHDHRPISRTSNRIPVPPIGASPTSGAVPPPLPIRQPQRQRQQGHYDVPAALRRPPSGANYAQLPINNDYAKTKQQQQQQQPYGNSGYHLENGYQKGIQNSMVQNPIDQRESIPKSISTSIAAAPPPPPPPPPPVASTSHHHHQQQRRYGATPIVDRIPAHEMALGQHQQAQAVVMRRSVSHTTGANWNNGQDTSIRGSVALANRSSYYGNGGDQQDARKPIPPPPPIRQQQYQQQRANSFSGALSNNGGVNVAIPNNENAAKERQQRMWNDLERQVVDDLEKKAVPIGLCHQCGTKVTNPTDATQALGHLYHGQCFTCCYCGRPLKGKKFYEARGKVYCEEDYLYSGFQHSAERCAACGHLIMDMILQAVGKSFHPACFKCFECRRALENVPFTVDEQGVVYCIDDYHRLFAPRCAKCRQPITPTNGREETVRVVAMQRDYHIDCYACEGCGLRLTDEDEKRCYPLGEHLLCQRCHVYWSRSGGASQPITDL